jgi:predicted lipoprotein with Yx(FWY)xxD motif
VRPDKHHRRAWLTVLIAAAVVLAGCGDDDEGTDAAATTTTAAGRATTTTAADEAAGAVVSKTDNPEFGEILVDAEGRTLYVFDNDRDGTIACVDACANAWPPLVLESGQSLPTTGELGSDLSAVARPDGAQQVAYKERPLYRYAGDGKPGDVNGDGVGGVWHVATEGGSGASGSSGGNGTTTTY